MMNGIGNTMREREREIESEREKQITREMGDKGRNKENRVDDENNKDTRENI